MQLIFHSMMVILTFFLRAQDRGYEAYAMPTLKIWNNKYSTGKNSAESISELFGLLTLLKSNYNLKQNIAFNRRHSNTFRSWRVFASLS